MGSSLLEQHSRVSLQIYYMIWGTNPVKLIKMYGYDLSQLNYEYILLYVDDLLHVSHNPDESMKQIMSQVNFKNDHYGEPEYSWTHNCNDKILMELNVGL